MRRFLATFIGLAAGAFLFSAVQAKEPPVTFPEGWKVTEKIEDGDTEWSATPKEGKDDPSIDVVDMSSDMFSQSTLNGLVEDMAKEFLGQTKDAFKSVNCEEKKFQKIGTVQVATVTCKVRGLTNMMFAFVAADKTTLMMIYEAEDAFFYKYLPAWQGVLNSVKIRN